MDRIKLIKENLLNLISSQMANIQEVDSEEFGEAIDCLKDIYEICYYETITKAMEEKEKEPSKEVHYYQERYLPYDNNDSWLEGRKTHDRMYYTEGERGSSSNSNSSSGYNASARGNNARGYHEYEYPAIERRDLREGRSPMSRKTYMESKELNHDRATQLKDLEMYMQELTQDIIEMIEDASPEEKQLLQKKISTLASKVQ